MSAVPDTRAPGSVAALRARYKDGKAALIEHFRAARPTTTAATQFLKGLTRHVDATLCDLWTHAGMPPGAALVAVGGYGRGELFPYSDVDVLVLLPAGQDGDARRAAIEGFITACWDIGLEIGSSVRTVDECVAEAERDVTVQTALLEARFVCGTRRLYSAFKDATGGALDPRAFLRAKTLEMQQRHVKYEGTPYALEPNCKESPGGLRDLQVVIWVARAAGLGRTWSELAGRGLVTPFEVSQLNKHEGTLKLVRARLHLVAGRREDRLVFDLQTAVAESFGYKATKGQRSSEVLMHRYYWAAKAVTQLNQILMLNIQERVSDSEAAPMRPITEHFLDRAGTLEVARDDLYLEQPRAILETFLVFARTPGLSGFSARTLRALYNARNVMDAGFRHDPVNRALFLELLRQPRGITHAFRLMNQTSVLGRYLWVFRRIVGRMQHDLFHVYTVDQHILMVLRNVRRFFIPEHAHEYPFCSQLAATFEPHWVLYVAALFHDVAKGRGGDHSDLGAVEVRRFCREHAIGREDSQLVEFLVKHHLTMSRIAQKEDLSDAEVIPHFGHQTRRWNPKMKRYIFGERGGIYIIDLQQTIVLLEQACDVVREISQRGGTVLFVGTKKQSQDAVADQARRCGMPYVSHRWLGGLLTNWGTISQRIRRLHELRNQKREGQLELLPTRERLAREGELVKLETNLGGVADMQRLPDAVVIVDLKKEAIGVREANRLGLAVIGLVDTNCDPDEATYVIPGNDDAIRACGLILGALADAVLEGKGTLPESGIPAPESEAGEAPAPATDQEEVTA